LKKSVGEEKAIFSRPGLLQPVLNQGSDQATAHRWIADCIAILVIVSLAGIGLTLAYPSQSQFACQSGATLRSFVVIANETTGYNDSRYQPFEMNAHAGDCVLVSFVNTAKTEVHSIAINYYMPYGVVAQPGQTKTAKFQVTTTGQFQVYEPTVSSINAFTLKCGTLNIT
jgi:hypothetical protein